MVADRPRCLPETAFRRLGNFIKLPPGSERPTRAQPICRASRHKSAYVFRSPRMAWSSRTIHFKTSANRIDTNKNGGGLNPPQKMLAFIEWPRGDRRLTALKPGLPRPFFARSRPKSAFVNAENLAWLQPVHPHQCTRWRAPESSEEAPPIGSPFHRPGCAYLSDVWPCMD